MRTVISKLSEFEVWTEKHKYSKYLAFDTETTGLDITTLEILGFSLSDGEDSCYVRLGKECPVDVIKTLMNRTLIMHNAVYDLKVLKKYGLEPEKIICTLVGAKLIDGERGKGQYSLKILERDWLNRASKEIITYDKAESFGTESHQFAEYAMDDAEYTYKLWSYEEPRLIEQKLQYLFYEIEMPFQFVIRDMEYNGIKIDTNELESLKKQVKIKQMENESEILKIFGLRHLIQGSMFEPEKEYISPINFGSSKQLIEITENRLHFPVDEYTDKGNKSFSDKYLLKMKDKHLFFELMRKHRSYTKMLDAYISPYFNLVAGDGRCRCSYHLIRSGRLSSSEPNHQQLPNPKRGKTEFNFRKIFIPKPGNVFVKGDYSGQELRVLGEVSKDETMLKAFRSGLDLHLVTANFIFNLGLSKTETTEGTPEYKEAVKQHIQERYKAKNGVNFPVVYGTSPMGISMRMGVSKEEAKRWMDKFFELYPGVKKSIEQTRKELEKNEYVTTLMGRRRRFTGYNHLSQREKSEALRMAFNHKIQGFSADIGKIAGSRILKILGRYNATVVMFIHDEFLLECPKEYAEELAKELKSVMENCVSISISMIVDVKIVKNFGD